MGRGYWGPLILRDPGMAVCFQAAIFLRRFFAHIMKDVEVLWRVSWDYLESNHDPLGFTYICLITLW